MDVDDELETQERLSISSGDSLQAMEVISFESSVVSSGSSSEGSEELSILAIRELLGLDEIAEIPSPVDLSPTSLIHWRDNRDVSAARELRDDINSRMKTHVCSVCACYQPAGAVRWCRWDYIPNVSLLLLGGQATAEVPRSGHTYLRCPDGRHYALLDSTDFFTFQRLPEASARAACENPDLIPAPGYCHAATGNRVFVEEGVRQATTLRTIHRTGNNLLVKICSDCEHSLRNHTIPRASLLRIDPGCRPYDLEPLTLLESMCLSRLRPHRSVVICRPCSGDYWRDPSQFTRGLRSHVVALRNPDFQSWGQLFDIWDPSLLPEIIQVILLAPCRTRSEMARLY